LTPPRGALAATRHFEAGVCDGVYSTNVYLTAQIERGRHPTETRSCPRAFSAVTYKIVPKRHVRIAIHGAGMRRLFIRTATRSAGCGGRQATRVAAALPASPEATISTPLCGALAATRQYEKVKTRCRGALAATRQYEKVKTRCCGALAATRQYEKVKTRCRGALAATRQYGTGGDGA
jgi:hypothetical protein